MRRLASWTAVIATLVAVTGCGTQSITAKYSQGGISISIVASGSQAAIDAAKAQIKSQGTSGAGAGVTFADGDSHDGNKICETDVTDSGQTYHVVIYSNSSLIPASTCAAMGSSGSSSSSST